jgi:HSP20 family protein
MFGIARVSMNPVWQSLNEMQSEMNRLFDRWGNQPFGMVESPALNLWEEGDSLYLEAELPGLNIDDVEIYVTGRNQLTVKGERKPQTQEGAQYHRQERWFGNFTRSITLPFPVDENNVEARFENGILKVRLPKHETARPRKINIKA